MYESYQLRGMKISVGLHSELEEPWSGEFRPKPETAVKTDGTMKLSFWTYDRVELK